MKTLIFSLALIIFISTFAFSQEGCDTNKKEIKRVSYDYQWASVRYTYNSGPLPPKFQFSYTVVANNNGDGQFIYNIGNDPAIAPLIYEIIIPPDKIKLLDVAVKKSRILDTEITAMPENKHPIGGHLQKVMVIVTDTNSMFDRPPQVKTSPFFPTDEFKEDLNGLCEFMGSLVPKDIWTEVETKRTEYEENYKK